MLTPLDSRKLQNFTGMKGMEGILRDSLRSGFSHFKDLTLKSLEVV
jgi:hypothetical protein